MSHRWAYLAAASGIVLGLAGAARGETLADAIAMAYQSNPTLTGQRAEQRALDETYVQAKSGLRPNANVQATTEYQREDFGAGGGSFTAPSGAFLLSPGSGTVEANAGIAQLTVNQPLYTGGRTVAGIRSAEASVMAGREGLRSTEESVLFSVIQAYADVLRDQKIVGIRRNNVDVLASQLDETSTKFQVGQVTRTDTAQAAAQLAQARALLTSAQAQFQISRAEYAAVVGQNPGELAPPPPLPGLPPTVDQAFDEAEANNPVLKRAKSTEQASRQKVVQAKGANLPTVSLQASLGYEGALEPFAARDYDRAFTALATVTQPIFTGGLNASNIRAAIEQNNADRIGIEAARRQVVQGVAQAWNTMSASHANIASNQEQVRSAGIAFEGEQAEYRAGLRTTLDVLIAQETLRDAELALVQAQHDDYVAEANLLSTTGRLEAKSLVRGVSFYDPAKSFNRVKNAGGTPWDGVVEAIDSIGAPRAGVAASAVQPQSPAGEVTMVPADQPVAAHQPLSTAQPTAPTPSPASASAPLAAPGPKG